MNIHLTLVAANDDLKKSHFEKLNVSDSHIKWLIPNKVAFIKIENTLPLAEMKKFRVSLNKDKIDIFCVEQKPRHLFMADMDSTIVTSETLDELADEVGIKDQVATITERAMRGERTRFLLSLKSITYIVYWYQAGLRNSLRPLPHN